MTRTECNLSEQAGVWCSSDKILLLLKSGSVQIGVLGQTADSISSLVSSFEARISADWCASVENQCL